MMKLATYIPQNISQSCSPSAVGSELDKTPRGARNVRNAIARVHDQAPLACNHPVVEFGVVSENQDAIGTAQLFLCRLDGLELRPVHLIRRNMRVGVGDLRAFSAERGDDFVGWGLPRVADAPLVRDPEHEDSGALE